MEPEDEQTAPLGHIEPYAPRDDVDQRTMGETDQNDGTPGATQ